MFWVWSFGKGRVEATTIERWTLGQVHSNPSKRIHAELEGLFEGL